MKATTYAHWIRIATVLAIIVISFTGPRSGKVAVPLVLVVLLATAWIETAGIDRSTPAGRNRFIAQLWSLAACFGSAAILGLCSGFYFWRFGGGGWAPVVIGITWGITFMSLWAYVRHLGKAAKLPGQTVG